MTIRLVLVDDQPLVRMGFRLVLEATGDIQVIGEAGDGAMGVERTLALQPDVVLMDVRMTGMDGVEATRQICASQVESRVIVLTTFDLDEYAFAALQAGASGSAAAGDAVISPRITRELLNRHAAHLDVGFSETGALSDPLESLTPREREVFQAMSAGMTNSEIGSELFMSEATAKTHVNRILTKLGLRDRVQAVIFSYEHRLRDR
jgi:DNA-binding NarL/FixJ family response regulator